MLIPGSAVQRRPFRRLTTLIDNLCTGRHILQLVLQHWKLFLNRRFVRQCLQDFMKLLLWIRRRCRPWKGLLEEKSADATRDVTGASWPYEKETPLYGIRSLGHWDSEVIQNMCRACSPFVLNFSTSSDVPGIVGVTDAIASPVDPSPSLLSLQGSTTDSQAPDEPQQDTPGSPGPLPDPQDILLSPERQTPFESQSFSHPTLWPFVPEMLGRYERNVEM